MLNKIGATFVLRVLTAVINLLIVIALSHGIGAAGKGEASIIITNIAITMIFCNMVGGSTLVFLVPRYGIRKLLLPSYLWALVSCAAAGIVTYYFPAGAPGMSLHIFFLSLLSAVLSIHLTALLGKERVAVNNWLSLLQTVITILVLVILVFVCQQKNVHSYVVSLYAALGICTLISTILLLPFLRGENTEHAPPLKELITLGTINQLGHILQFMSLRISYYVLDHTNGEAAVGVYSNGTSLAESLWLISNSIAMVQYAHIANSTDLDSSRSLTLRLMKLSLAACALALLPLLLLPSSAYVWLFGHEFAGVRSVIITLAPGVMMYNFALITGHYFSGIGKYHINSIANALGLAVTIGMSLLLLNRYSPAYAGIIASASYTVTSVFVIACFLKESRYSTMQLLPSRADVRELRKQLQNSLAAKRK